MRITRGQLRKIINEELRRAGYKPLVETGKPDLFDDEDDYADATTEEMPKATPEEDDTEYDPW